MLSICGNGCKRVLQCQNQSWKNSNNSVLLLVVLRILLLWVLIYDFFPAYLIYNITQRTSILIIFIYIHFICKFFCGGKKYDLLYTAGKKYNRGYLFLHIVGESMHCFDLKTCCSRADTWWEQALNQPHKWMSRLVWVIHLRSRSASKLSFQTCTTFLLPQNT